MNKTANQNKQTTNLPTTWRHPVSILHAWKNRFLAVFLSGGS
jgi:hypothetical protein